MIVYWWSCTNIETGVVSKSWYPTEKEARDSLRAFRRKACGPNGDFRCDDCFTKETITHKGDLLGLLNGITNGYEVDQYA